METGSIIAIVVAIITLIFSCFFYCRGIRNEEIHRLKDSLFDRCEMLFNELLKLNWDSNNLTTTEIDQIISNNMSIILLINKQLNKRCNLHFLTDSSSKTIFNITDIKENSSIKNKQKSINDIKYFILEEIENLYTTQWFSSKFDKFWKR